MVKVTLKSLQQMLQDFLNVFNYFRTFCIKELNKYIFLLCARPVQEIS